MASSMLHTSTTSNAASQSLKLSRRFANTGAPLQSTMFLSPVTGLHPIPFSCAESSRRIPCQAQGRTPKQGRSRSQGPRSIHPKHLSLRSRRVSRLRPLLLGRKCHSPVCSKAVPADIAGPRIPEFQLSASEDSNPIVLPSYSAEGYYEWHHSSHLQEGPGPIPPHDSHTSTPSSENVHDITEKRHTTDTSEGDPTKTLLNVPVLTREEQLELAATPAHPAALNALYYSHCLNCLSEHSWRFLSPALLSLMHQSLLPVACASFVGQLIIFVGAPWVGHFMDSTPRVTAFNTLAVVQTVAIVVSAAATVYGLANPPQTTLSGGALLTQPWFFVVMATSAVDKLTGLASGVAFERDWVILLAGQNRPIALASANAILRRVDLFCELAGPMSFGWLLSTFPPFFCLKVAMALAVVSLPILLLLVYSTDKLSSGALGRPRESSPKESSPQSSGSSTSGSSPEGTGSSEHQGGSAQSKEEGGEERLAGNPFSAIVVGWRSFLGQSVLPASIAYVLLYFNAVLSPGGLMTSFLTQRGVDVSIIGAFRGACAAMGFAATFVSAPLVARLGLLNAGAGALIFQSLLLALSVGVFYISKANNTNQTGLLMLFLGLVVFSRLGHWVYDVVDAQIFQTAVPSSEANLVGTTEIALASLAELVMLGTAIVLHDVSRFGQLAMLSMASVLAATAIYCVWLAKADSKRDAMFPKRPEWAFGREERGGLQGGVDGVKSPPAEA